ncbi:MAG: hypothetical protein ABIR32_06935 [Ilumatobacteraceae bacterium]
MIDEAIGLFALSPGEFVAERNRLAKLLKINGRTDDATLVSSLKRPKLSEYALNRLAHEHGPIIDRLVDAIDAAAEAQAAAIDGDASTLRDATSELRGATKSAVDSAVQLLTGEGANGEGQRDEIVALVRRFVGSGDTEPLRLGVVEASAVAGGDDFFRGASDVADRPTPKPTQMNPATAKPATTKPKAVVKKAPPPPPVGPSPADRARKIQLERQLHDAQSQVERAERSVAEAAELLAQAQRKVDDRLTVLHTREAALADADAALATFRKEWPDH